ncbi:MAG: transporter substrate-binding domain-containing protein [Marinobacterium sp.]|nr:transporter substrate-binding domain-containing protein [Marinobacterium sp.]
MLRLFFVVLLSCLALPVLALPLPLKVGMPLPGQVPYFWQDDGGEYRGIYADVLRQLVAGLDIELQFVPLSQARLLRHFEMGEIDLEAGVTGWAETAPQAGENLALRKVSLFTRPFGLVNEVIIYRPELSFPVFILKDLKNRRVATVRGSVVPGWLVREDLANAWKIAQRVHRGWNDIGLMKEAVALHYQRSAGLNYRISLPYQSNPVSFRLHRSRAELLPEFDRRIARMERSGELDEIVCRYLCGTLE